MGSRSLEDELAAFEQEIAGLGGEEAEEAEEEGASLASSAVYTASPASQVPSAAPYASPPPPAVPAAVSSLPHPSMSASPSPVADPAALGPSSTATAALKRAREDVGDAFGAPAVKKPSVISAKHSAVISAQPTPAEKLDAAAAAAAAAATISSVYSTASSSAMTASSPSSELGAHSAARSALAATASSSAALSSSSSASSSFLSPAAPDDKAGGKRRVDPALVRAAAGEVWVDPTLASFPPDDFRIFVGDLGIEVNDALLSKAFSHYASFAMARVVRDKKSALSRGFGFVSFLEHEEGLRALKEMNGKYCGNRPMKLKKGQWQKRSLDAKKKRDRRT